MLQMVRHIPRKLAVEPVGLHRASIHDDIGIIGTAPVLGEKVEPQKGLKTPRSICQEFTRPTVRQSIKVHTQTFSAIIQQQNK